MCAHRYLAVVGSSHTFQHWLVERYAGHLTKYLPRREYQVEETVFGIVTQQNTIITLYLQTEHCGALFEDPTQSPECQQVIKHVKGANFICELKIQITNKQRRIPHFGLQENALEKKLLS